MNPIVNIDTTLEFRVDDRPTITGTVYDSTDQFTFLDVLYFVDDHRGSFIPETLVYSYSNSSDIMTIILDRVYDTRTSGQIMVLVLPDSTHTATLDAGVTALSGATDTVTTSDTLRDTGWCKIDNEWCKYNLTGTTLSLYERGLFGTTAATHAASATVYFAYSKQAAIPKYELIVKDKTEL